ncbi:MAG: hypothetical protein JHD07_27100 [Bradyrhizobium sp.]|jgi:hypothetical protein|nr:hypothetical protein [Bradyrhizobium sp.]MBJ7406772.1 hypothetical protein [Bradyrhizobium sp.]
MFPSELVSRLNENIGRGRAARDVLGQKLAEMPPRDIAKLPRAVLTRIGPAGIATMARVAAGTDDALPAAIPAPIRIQSQDRPADGPPPLWLVCCAASLIVIAVTIFAGILDRPLRWAIASSGYLSADDVGLCNRLDRWTEDCNFPVTAQGLSPDDIAVHLGRAQSSFSISPTTLHTDGSLPIGTIVDVHRNRER